MTAPFVPADCDLRDFPRMMIDIPRLRASAFDATPDDAAWRAALNLWMSSWHGDPAASLEDDEGALCKAAGLGRDLRTWRKIQPIALRGWTLCSDGRLYHATVAEFALEAWLEKLAQRLSSGAGNAKRWGSAFDPDPIRAEITVAAGLLAALNPKSNALLKASRYMSRSHPNGTQNNSRRDTETIPSGSQGKGREEDISLRSISPARSTKPKGRFDEFWSAYPRKVGKGAARPAYDRALRKIGGEDPHGRLMAALAMARPTWTDPQFIPHPATWLNRDGWEDELPGASDQSQASRVLAWGPAEWRAAVEVFVERGRWSEAAGPAPGLPGCRAPPDILAAFNLAPSPEVDGEIPFPAARSAA